MAHVSSGKNVGHGRCSVICDSKPRISRCGAKFSGSKDGRPEGGDVAYGLRLLVF